MARVRYIPEPGTPAIATQFGIEFGPEPVEVTDPRIIAKCKGSPFYEVIEVETPQAPPSDPQAPLGYRAVHNGGGRFIIVYGDKDEKVAAGLNKADADAFNSMSEDDKAAYVEAMPK